MAIRGETIGTAYVRILADGGGLDESIKRQFRETQPAIDAEGRRAAKTYQGAFEEEYDKALSKSDMDKMFREAVVGQDAVNKFINGPEWAAFRKRLEREYKDAGLIAGNRMEEGLIQSGSVEALEGMLRQLTPRLAAAQAEFVKISEEETAALEKDQQEREALGRRQLAFEKKQKEEFLKIRREEAKWRRELEDINKDVVKSLDAAHQAIMKTWGGIKDVNKDINEGNTIVKKWARRWGEAEGAVAGFGRGLESFGGKLSALGPKLDRAGDSVGRLFGKGSRNDFLNFFGSVVGGLAVLPLKFITFLGRAVEIVGKAFEDMAEISNAFFKGFTDAASEGSSVLLSFVGGLTAAAESQAFQTIATDGLNLVAALGVLSIALTGMIFSLGIVASAVVLLGAVLTALVSTITFAVIAALGAIAPLILPIAAAVGGVVIAFMELKNASGPLKASMDKVKAAGKSLKETFSKALFADANEQAGLFTSVLDKFGPLARKTGRALKDAFTGFLEGLDSPAFERFLNAMERFIPDAIRSLGVIFGNTFAGIGNLLRGAIPLAEQFLGWLEDITAAFAGFGDTKKEQSEIRAFFDKASEAAQSLFDFLGQLGGLIMDVLFPAQATGNTIFDDMTAKLEQVRQWLDDHPDALKKWFEDGLRFARSLGRGIEFVVGAIDALDSPSTRKGLFALINLLRIFSNLMLTVADVAIQVTSAIENAFFLMSKAIIHSLGVAIDALASLPALVGGPATIAARKIQDGWHNMEDAVDEGHDNIQQTLKDLKAGIDNFQATLNPPDTRAAEAALASIEARIRNIGNQPVNVHFGEFALPPGGGAPAPPKPPPRGVTTPRVVVTQNITSPQADPVAVANEVLNHLVVAGR